MVAGRIRNKGLLKWLLLGGLVAPVSASPGTVTFENPQFRYVISEQGRNVEFVDRATGTNYLNTNAPSWCGSIRVENKEHAATSAKLTDGQLQLSFADAGVT